MNTAHRLLLGLGLLAIPSVLAIGVASRAAAQAPAPVLGQLVPGALPVGSKTYEGSVMIGDKKTTTYATVKFPTLCTGGQAFLLTHVEISPYTGQQYPATGRWAANVGITQAMAPTYLQTGGVTVFGDTGSAGYAALGSGVAFAGNVDVVMEKAPSTPTRFSVLITGSCGTAPALSATTTTVP